MAVCLSVTECLTFSMRTLQYYTSLPSLLIFVMFSFALLLPMLYVPYDMFIILAQAVTFLRDLNNEKKNVYIYPHNSSSVALHCFV